MGIKTVLWIFQNSRHVPLNVLSISDTCWIGFGATLGIKMEINEHQCKSTELNFQDQISQQRRRRKSDDEKTPPPLIRGQWVWRRRKKKDRKPSFFFEILKKMDIRKLLNGEEHQHQLDVNESDVSCGPFKKNNIISPPHLFSTADSPPADHCFCV
jgi:hypothetical protein